MSRFLPVGNYEWRKDGSVTARLGVASDAGSHVQWWSTGRGFRPWGTGRLGKLVPASVGGSASSYIKGISHPSGWYVGRGAVQPRATPLPGGLTVEESRQLNPGTMELRQGGKVVGALLVLDVAYAGARMERWAFFQGAEPVSRKTPLVVVAAKSASESSVGPAKTLFERLVSRNRVVEEVDVRVRSAEDFGDLSRELLRLK